MNLRFNELREYVRTTPEYIKNILFSAVMFILVAGISFGVGRSTGLHHHRSPIVIQEPQRSQSATTASSTEQVPLTKKVLSPMQPRQPPVLVDPGGKIIGVKSSKNYYFPWCGTVKRLKETNVAVFDSIEAARAAGYKPAKNCKGLQ
jgi:hypothetical protein